MFDKTNMIDSINCEPYGYLKYNPDDVDNIMINEVEDIRHITEDMEIIEVGNYKLILTYILTILKLNKLNKQ